jgi:hypothetical protein
MCDGRFICLAVTGYRISTTCWDSNTLGHVLIARDRRSLEETRAHERVHVRQCETWGPLFVPAYLTASLWAVWRGRNFYFDNWFEVEAFQMARVEHGAQSAVRREVTPGVRG